MAQANAQHMECADLSALWIGLAQRISECGGHRTKTQSGAEARALQVLRVFKRSDINTRLAAPRIERLCIQGIVLRSRAPAFSAAYL